MKEGNNLVNYLYDLGLEILWARIPIVLEEPNQASLNETSKPAETNNNQEPIPQIFFVGESTSKTPSFMLFSTQTGFTVTSCPPFTVLGRYSSNQEQDLSPILEVSLSALSAEPEPSFSLKIVRKEGPKEYLLQPTEDEED